jgi:hypothetical protein
VIISQTIQTVNKSDIISTIKSWHQRLMEDELGRVINPEGAGKERTQLMRSVVLALRELMQQTTTDHRTQDLAAYIALALLAIDETVEVSVTAWEKRDYWLKADRFRMEWAWAKRLGERMRSAVLAENWPMVAQTAAAVAEKVKDISVPKRHGLGEPWNGSMQRLQTLKVGNGAQPR